MIGTGIVDDATAFAVVLPLPTIYICASFSCFREVVRWRPAGWLIGIFHHRFLLRLFRSISIVFCSCFAHVGGWAVWISPCISAWAWASRSKWWRPSWLTGPSDYWIKREAILHLAFHCSCWPVTKYSHCTGSCDRWPSHTCCPQCWSGCPFRTGSSPHSCSCSCSHYLSGCCDRWRGCVRNGHFICCLSCVLIGWEVCHSCCLASCGFFPFPGCPVGTVAGCVRWAAACVRWLCPICWVCYLFSQGRQVCFRRTFSEMRDYYWNPRNLYRRSRDWIFPTWCSIVFHVGWLPAAVGILRWRLVLVMS